MSNNNESKQRENGRQQPINENKQNGTGPKGHPKNS